MNADPKVHLFRCACVGTMLAAAGLLLVSGLVPSEVMALADTCLSGAAATVALSLLQT